MQTPKHIAIICDGNRRWAKERGWEVFKGHEQAVMHVIEPLVDHAIEREITHLTFWIFSTENWQRNKIEVQGLMNLFRSFFDRQLDELHQKGVRLNMIGRVTDFDQDIQDRIIDGMAKTYKNNKITVTLAMSYGGRDEITRAVQQLAEQVAAGKLKPAQITKQLISEQLDTGRTHIPDPDLIIRTSGEHRLSGFMMWQSEYSEFWFPDFKFPEFTPARLDEALQVLADRKRRFGK